MLPPESIDCAAPAPERPTSVPSHAHWEPSERVYRLGQVDNTGKRVGRYLVYREDGSLQAELLYEQGELHGPFKRFHPNGELAREGRFERGVWVDKVVAYNSTGPTPETLRNCCVPPGAWKLICEQYRGITRDKYYDREGRRLLQDGSLHPVPPANVPETANYLFEDERWEFGNFLPAEREGRFTWWSKTGELVEAADYRSGKLDGIRESHAAGRCVSRWQYAAGVAHGRGFEHLPQGSYLDDRIAWVEGEYEHGTPMGEWVYRDAHDAPLYRVDFGAALAALEPHDEVFTAGLSAQPADHETRRQVLEQLTARRYLAAALLVNLRDAATLKDVARLDALTRSVPQMTISATDERMRALRAQNLPPAEALARLLHTLLRGGQGDRVLREVARFLLLAPKAALAHCDVALSLNEEHAEAHALQAMLHAELGQERAARASVTRLKRWMPDGADALELLLRVTFATFEFVPDKTPLLSWVGPNLPTTVDQDVGCMRLMIGKCALRLGLVRTALIAQLGTVEAWFPPDLSALVTADTTLQRYTFETEDADEPDVIRVDEALDVSGLSAGNLMRRARLDWNTLCWVCFACGLNRVSLPQQVDPPDSFAHAITTAFAHHFRATDQHMTNGLRSRAQGRADFVWEGAHVSQLSGSLLIQARDEFLEMRTALFFSADRSCRSLWQDDLRGQAST